MALAGRPFVMPQASNGSSLSQRERVRVRENRPLEIKLLIS
jgi:hypothetical protein